MLAYKPWDDTKYVEIFGEELAVQILEYNARASSQVPISTPPRNNCSGVSSIAPAMVIAEKGPAFTEEMIMALVAKAVAGVFAATKDALSAPAPAPAVTEGQPVHS